VHNVSNNLPKLRRCCLVGRYYPLLLCSV